jgi:hypothetical protein
VFVGGFLIWRSARDPTRIGPNWASEIHCGQVPARVPASHCASCAIVQKAKDPYDKGTIVLKPISRADKYKQV